MAPTSNKQNTGCGTSYIFALSVHVTRNNARRTSRRSRGFRPKAGEGRDLEERNGAKVVNVGIRIVEHASEELHHHLELPGKKTRHINGPFTDESLQLTAQRV